MASGIKLNEACKVAYDDIQKDKKHRYVIFLIKDDKEIVVEKIGERTNTYEDYLKDLQQKDGKCDDCRYGLFDYEYSVNPYGEEKMTRSKTFLMSWAPDSARVKKKMMYSASFDTIKKAFTGVSKIIQANDVSDIAQNNVEELLRATDKY